MIHEVDSALRTLIEREAGGMRDVEIVFDAPTREWAGRRNSPTVDVYLYDIREDLRRRERGMHNVYDDRKVVVARHLPPRHFKLSYLITAWTQRPEDEHRLLSSLLSCFLSHEALPRDVLTGPLAELNLPIPITIALPPPEDRAFADVWSALGGELKPSIDLVVVTPLDTGQHFHTGPPVEQPPRISVGGSGGWPTREAKSRLGVEQWPDGIDGPRPDSDGAADRDQADGEDEAAAGKSGGRGRGRRTAKSPAGTAASGASAGAGSAGAGSAGAGSAGGRSGAARSGEPAAGSDNWTRATGWAAAMAPLGSAEVTGPVPGRAAGRPATGFVTTGGSGGSAGADPADAAPGDAGSTDAGTGAKSAAKSTSGRPGPRVAMTRVRQTKKRT